MRFIYRSPVGVFYIAPYRDGRWGLGVVGDDVLGFYPTPQAAADDVYMQVTGYDDWDMLDVVDIIDAPPDLGEWERLP